MSATTMPSPGVRGDRAAFLWDAPAWVVDEFAAQDPGARRPRWLGRVMRRGRDRAGLALSAEICQQFADAAWGRPLRCRIMGRSFEHPPRDRDPWAEGDLVGVTERCWFDGEQVLAVFRLLPEATRLDAALHGMRADGTLHRLAGLSFYAAAPRRYQDLTGPPVGLASVDCVHAVDLISEPAGRECCVLRPATAADVARVACEEEVRP